MAERRTRTPLERRVHPSLEKLDDRIVPTTFDYWMNTTGNGLWSDARNWSMNAQNVIPDSTMVAVLDFNSSNTNVSYDSAVPVGNRTIAGIETDGGYSATLTLQAGFALTVSADSSDNTTGLKWSTGNITQSTASDTLIVTGGGTGGATGNNFWSGGAIGSGTAQSNVYINGGSSLQITQNAAGLGDNIIIGQDGNGGSTLEFYNQAATLQVNNNASLVTATNSSDLTPPNQILFDTDLTQPGTASYGLQTTVGGDSFIDNYGQVIRSNPGLYQTDLPIRNEPVQNSGDKGLLDVQLPSGAQQAGGLWISGFSANKTANNSLDQEGGKTLLENGALLKVNNTALIKAGYLQTYGAASAIIQANTQGTAALNFQGGTMTISADNPASYGSLSVAGDMTWTGGTFECYVNGQTAGQQTQLRVGGSLNLVGGNGHLHMNVVGGLNSGQTWMPVLFSSRAGTLTFDSGGQFTIAYNLNNISVTSR